MMPRQVMGKVNDYPAFAWMRGAKKLKTARLANLNYRYFLAPRDRWSVKLQKDLQL